MYTSKTPYRVSFFGGGTDYSEWFSHNGGCFISMGINKYCYIHCRHLPPFFGYKNRIVWSKIEQVNNVSEISHPAIRAALKMERMDRLEIHHVGDLPARSGLGTSSSFSVGLLNVLRFMKGQKETKIKLANDAIYLERNLLGEAGGIQDQIAASFGGLNFVKIKKDGNFSVKKISLEPEVKKNFETSLLLIFTGIFRNSYGIATKQIKSIEKSHDRLQEIDSLTKEALEIMKKVDFVKDFGKLLNETWHAKKSLDTEITNDFIDEIYDTALAAGAFGGKLLGAGSGGFMIFVVPKSSISNVKSALNKLVQVPVEIDEFGTLVSNGTK